MNNFDDIEKEAIVLTENRNGGTTPSKTHFIAK